MFVQMTRTEELAYITATFTAAECLRVATDLAAAAAQAGIPSPSAGVWFEAADLFERAVDDEEAAATRRAKGELVEFNDAELVALDGNSGAVVVFAHGRFMSSVQRRRTATSDNITFQCLYEGLINDEVIPAWDDSGVEITSDSLPF